MDHVPSKISLARHEIGISDLTERLLPKLWAPLGTPTRPKNQYETLKNSLVYHHSVFPRVQSSKGSRPTISFRDRRNAILKWEYDHIWSTKFIFCDRHP